VQVGAVRGTYTAQPPLAVRIYVVKYYRPARLINELLSYPKQLSQEVNTAAAVLSRVLGYNLKYGWLGATKRQFDSQFYQVRNRHERDHLGRTQPNPTQRGHVS
jgi:hypothetical protein